MRTKTIHVIGGALIWLCGVGEADAQKRTQVLLYSFTGGSDGAQPRSSLTADAEGNLYGTATRGGPYSHGVVYRLSPDGTFKVLYAFFGEKDGEEPRGGVIFDAAGNLYGTAASGGINNAGVIFKIAPDGRESTFHSFGKQQGDGYLPNGDLVADEAGNFYGVTEGGGANGWGTVYSFTPSGKEKVLYSFAAGAPDAAPVAGLVRDAAGNLYGTGSAFGTSGAVFKLAPDGTETILYTFYGGDDGSTPVAPLVMDKNGALYGTTLNAGANQRGVIFKIAADGNESTVHAFNGSDGEAPYAGLIAGKKGNLYGTTCEGGRLDGGTAYKLTPDGKVVVLHSFGVKGRGPDCPAANLMIDSAGNLFGTTAYGGVNFSGTIFEIKAR